MVQFLGNALGCSDNSIVLPYPGLSMTAAHSFMNITNADFNYFNQAVLQVMATNGVSTADQSVSMSDSSRIEVLKRQPWLSWRPPELPFAINLIVKSHTLRCPMQLWVLLLWRNQLRPIRLWSLRWLRRQTPPRTVEVLSSFHCWPSCSLLLLILCKNFFFPIVLEIKRLWGKKVICWSSWLMVQKLWLEFVRLWCSMERKCWSSRFALKKKNFVHEMNENHNCAWFYSFVMICFCTGKIYGGAVGW